MVGWVGNPLLRKGTLTEEDFAASGHVAVAVGAHRTASFGDRQLALMGKVRRIEILSPSFTTVPWLLKDTMRLSVMHERLALRMGEFFPIALAPMPFHFPPMNEMLQYHQSRSRDDGLTWLRGQVFQHAT